MRRKGSFHERRRISRRHTRAIGLPSLPVCGACRYLRAIPPRNFKLELFGDCPFPFAHALYFGERPTGAIVSLLIL